MSNREDVLNKLAAQSADRRRQTKKLCMAMFSLAKHEHVEDDPQLTARGLELFGRLILMSDADREGTRREVLEMYRQVEARAVESSPRKSNAKKKPRADFLPPYLRIVK